MNYVKGCVKTIYLFPKIASFISFPVIIESYIRLYRAPLGPNQKNISEAKLVAKYKEQIDGLVPLMAPRS